MTSRPSRDASDAGTLEKFPDFPPREDMQNSLHLDDDAHQAILRRHFGNNPATVVLSEIPVRSTPSQREGHRIPDLLISFDVDRALAVEQNGYSIQDQGKPPDFVLEIASSNTAEEDNTDKRDDYAGFGIPEYWRFDPTGGDRCGAAIAGARLVGGIYQAVDIEEVEPGHLHGHSEVLGLHPCWHDGRLRWYDPETQGHLLTLDEESEAHIAEREGRIAEREGRIAAEARIRELEAELERSQGP